MGEESSDSDAYEDITELKRQLEGAKGKKDISSKELYRAMQKLAETMTDMLEVFGTAAEQMKLQEKEYETEAKKHDTVINKLDKLIDQNRTIAQGMVAIVDMIKENTVEPVKEKEELFQPKEREESLFKPIIGPKQVSQPQPLWQPSPEPATPKPIGQPIAPPPMASMPTTSFGAQMPPMEPEPLPDLDFPEEPFPIEEPKKKGLFGMFKK